jgi:hypothetical protein
VVVVFEEEGMVGGLSVREQSADFSSKVYSLKFYTLICVCVHLQKGVYFSDFL